MSFKDIDQLIKGNYDSSIDNVIESFYSPVLMKAKNYDRIAGFFSSSSLAISCKGLLNIAQNGGKIRFLVSPKLSEADVKTISDAQENPDSYISNLMVDNLNSYHDELQINYRNLLGHLIAKGVVEIKVVMVKNGDRYLTSDEIDQSSLFHIKIGVLYDDEDNILSFSGSINETYTAWNNNIEEFKTFKSWDAGQLSYCLGDKKKFDDFWNGDRERIEVLDLPDAVKKKYIDYSNNTDFVKIVKSIQSNDRKVSKKQINDILFWYQKDAFNMWKENNYQLMFAMATGTGKTLTALACTEYLLNKERLLVIIATPQSALSMQWLGEVNDHQLKFDNIISCDSNFSYKTKLEEHILNMNLGLENSLAIFTTHATSYTSDFLQIIYKLDTTKTNILFIGDEVHGLGSKEQRKALQNLYKYRIGLSATPSRWFDDEGSQLLVNYFGNKMFEFGIDRAISEINPVTGKTFLTPYNYYPWICYLNDEENIKYEDLTEKIRKLSFNDENEDLKIRRDILLQDRADIVKTCEDKLPVLKSLLEYLLEKNMQAGTKLDNTIIFTSPQHLVDTMKILNSLHIIASPLTEKQSNKPSPQYRGLSERQNIINEFKNKNIQVIVAIKCMDEGIDIPQADTAILMSSTTNPREYIQRIGRVIRRYENKKNAEIYDLVTKSLRKDIDDHIKKNEYTRAKYIIENASNGLEATNKIYG